MKTKIDKEIIVGSDKRERELIFAGAMQLLSEPKTPKERLERNLILATAKALNISPLGIVILGNQPYADNKARKEKLEQYRPGAGFEYNWARRSENDTDKAICEARIVVAKTALTPWIAGECSPASMGMSTLKGYQNHMAQTRAENRAFEHLYGVRLRKDLVLGLQKLMASGEVTEDVAQKALSAGTVSSEEVVGKPSQAGAMPAKTGELTKAEMYQKAKRMILKENIPAVLKDWKKGIQGSRSYMPGEIESLVKLIDEKLAQ